MHDSNTPLYGLNLVFQFVNVCWQISFNLLSKRFIYYVTELDLQKFDV